MDFFRIADYPPIKSVRFRAPPESSEFLRIDVLEDSSSAPNVLRNLYFSQLAPGPGVYFVPT